MEMEITSHDELKDQLFGKVGTAERDDYERRLEADMEVYHIGRAIKQARLAKKMTQEQFGKLLGVKKSQVSRLESGQNLTLSTVLRAFKALGVKSTQSDRKIAFEW